MRGFRVPLYRFRWGRMLGIAAILALGGVVGWLCYWQSIHMSVTLMNREHITEMWGRIDEGQRAWEVSEGWMGPDEVRL